VVFSGFIFGLSLIQIVEYAIHENANPNQSGKLIYVILWFQCFLINFGCFLYLNRYITPEKNYLYIISLLNLIFSTIVFISSIIYIFFTNDNIEAKKDNCHISWTTNSENFLGYYSYLYLYFIFIPFFLLIIDNYQQIGMYVLLLYGISSLLYSLYRYSNGNVGSIWCYLSIGFAFLVWFFGIEHSKCQI
jgi:hypothetical protein